MKNFFLFVVMAFWALQALAQVPSAFKYQAVLRDASGNIRADENVSIGIDILQGTVDGTIVYQESHGVTTNGYGLINLNIGMGSTNDDFDAIDWSNGPYFIKITVNGIEMGTSQLMSVPYAHFAERAANSFSGNYEDLTNTPDLSDTSEYIKEEYDPIFQSSVAHGIDQADTAAWNESKNKWFLKENNDLYYNKGLVGIGTSNPTSNLVVEGTGKSYDVRITDQNAFLALDGKGSNVGFQFLENGSYRTTMYYNPSYEYFQIYNAGSYGITLNSSNYVGIKTFYPETELHVNGSVRVDETNEDPSPKTVYGNSMPLAYASVSANGSILTGYGIESVTNTSTGYYTMTLNNSWTSYPVVIITCYNLTQSDEIPTYYASVNSNVVYIRLADGSGNPINSVYSVVVFGMPE
jgi:hypothetical protein